jgi:hypothetical protein
MPDQRLWRQLIWLVGPVSPSANGECVSSLLEPTDRFERLHRIEALDEGGTTPRNRRVTSSPSAHEVIQCLARRHDVSVGDGGSRPSCATSHVALSHSMASSPSLRFHSDRSHRTGSDEGRSTWPACCADDPSRPAKPNRGDHRMPGCKPESGRPDGNLTPARRATSWTTTNATRAAAVVQASRHTANARYRPPASASDGTTQCG